LVQKEPDTSPSRWYKKAVKPRLFNGTSRRLALTDTGRTLANRASALLAEAEAFESDARSQSTNPRGLVRLAAPMSFGVMYVAPSCRSSFEPIQRSQSTCISATRWSTSLATDSTPPSASRHRLIPR